MDEAATHRFSSHAEFEAQWRSCLAQSRLTLQMFDPDFSVFPLGDSDVDATLRQFLRGGGRLRLAMHRSDYIERHYPRFQRLIQDYSHAIECKVTGRSLHHLTDSFCIGDGVHIVRRFHSDHMRGEAAFCSPAATEINTERFDAIWLETQARFSPTTTGL